MKLKIVALMSLITLAALLNPAHAQTFSVIHNFNYADGASPMAGVTLRAGNLYGTTSNGGAPYANGNVYELTPSGDNWVLSSLYIFKGIAGRDATARPVFGPDGHLYGTTNMGGDDNGGVVFRVTPPVSICRTADCFWTGEVLYEFAYDLACPGFGDLVFDQHGNIYGIGECGGPQRVGGVYQLTFDGNSWVKTSIFLFPGFPNAAGTESGVIFDKNGNLFGRCRRRHK
jgi:uncharacterized repeat protein (TIGR03803 family)